MRKTSLLIIGLLFIVSSCDKTSVKPSMAIDSYKNNQSLDYDNLILHYKLLEENYSEAKLIDYGKSDIGKPLYAFVIDYAEKFAPQKGKVTLLINNAIHPGEPCGVDASVNLAEQLLKDKELKSLLKNVMVVIIPMYNIGGAHNRGCCSRANQNGPEEYGFRGNAQNLDLNRDFIKNDSRNSKVFAKIYHDYKPHLFVDTHASNGADYQYTMTLITSQLNKLNKHLAKYVQEEMQPYLFSEMEKENYPMVPYVNTMSNHPESGIVDYLETPRYSTGYVTLFNTISFVTETHMWKPYQDRVESTLIFLKKLITFAANNHTNIIDVVKKANKKTVTKNVFPINWELDTTKFTTIDFKGYEAVYGISDLTGLNSFKYDRNQPFTKPINYYNTYYASDSVEKPEYYIIPQAWEQVIERLQLNNIKLSKLKRDTIIDVDSYYIESFETYKNPYEGHYVHYNTKVKSEKQRIQFYKGDMLIPMNQKSNRFVIETLEPTAVDSYFNWGFFDAVIQQKEYFSAYIFEDKAKEILANNPELKKEFEEKRATDSTFKTSHYKQLDFIYKNSPYYEKSHNRYPVYRVMR
jgi:hypothetical protein